jgi:opine dehydrogenase
MSPRAVTVLGGGNTAFAVAANLTLRGFAVTLGEIPSFRHMVEPILADRTIHLDGAAERGAARLAAVTTDLSAALAANDLALLIVPAYAHRPFAEACAPHLRAGQTVVLMPGTLGALEFARIVREQAPALRTRDGRLALTIAETDTAPYVCRKLTPNSAHIWGVVSGLGLGVFPATQTERVRALLAELFPGVRTYPHVLACGLSALNPVVHPAGVLLNAGRIERARGEFFFYEEGVTPTVCRLIAAVDAERRAVGRALGLELPPVAEAFHAAGFGPRGDLWAVINGSWMLTQLRAPGAVETRWLTEDVPYGLGAWSALGEQLGVATPLLRALVDVAAAATGLDFPSATRTPQALGLGGLGREEMLKLVETGW